MRLVALSGLVLLVVACSDDANQPTAGGGSTANAGGDASGGEASGGKANAAGGNDSGGGPSSEGGSAQNGGSGGGGGTLIDSCPIPAADFAPSAVPNPGPNITRRRVALAVPTGEPAGLYTVDYYGNGSFYAETLKRFRLDGGTWQDEYVADEQWGFSIATALDTTSGDDPCIVYTDDYDSYVRLACDSISDRIVAPGGANALAVAANGPQKQMVRFDALSDALDYFTTDGGTPSVPVVVDEDISITALSLAVDASGTPHVAYHGQVGGSSGAYQLEVRYATLTAGGWQVETVASETSPTQEQGRGSVSIAIDPYGEPSIAYHRRSTRSLEIISREGGAFGAPVILDAPQPNFPNDDLGRYIALQIDCYARKRVVYSRNVSTDPLPDSHLYFGIATDSGLDQRQMVPLVTPFNGYDFDLAYEIDPAGHDHIGVMSGALQYVTR